MNDTLKETLNNFPNKRVLVMGDIILDKFSWGSVERVNPEQPAAPLVKIIKESYSLGGAANVANNIVSLGAKCTLYGIIGDGLSGKIIKKICKEKSIDLKKFNSKNQPLMKQRIIAHGQQITRLDFGEKEIKKISSETKNKIINLLKKEIKKFDIIILSDYDKEFFREDFCREIIQISNSNHIPILVDPKPKNLDFFKNCTLVCPNKKEAEDISGIKYSKSKEILVQMGRAISESVNSKYVIVTCGEEGMFCYNSPKEECIFVNTQAKEVADVTGAGDTFAATISLGLISGLEIKEAAKLANVASGIAVGKIGTCSITVKEIRNYLERQDLNTLNSRYF